MMAAPLEPGPPARRKEMRMKLTVFAATGGIGHEILAQAVAAGHDVTAAVRDPARLNGAARAREDAGGTGRPHALRIVTCDLATPDPTALRSAVSGADAVLSGLGPRIGRAEVGVASHGTRAMVEAMREAGARRLVVVSAAPVATVASPGRPHPPRSDPGDGFFMRHVFSPLT